MDINKLQNIPTTASMSWLEYGDQLNKNAFLFIYIREDTLIEKKLKMVTRCLKQGGNVNAADGNDVGNTPLHMAVRRREVELVRLLLREGADVTLKNKEQKTPHDIAWAKLTQFRNNVQSLKTSETASNNDKEKLEAGDFVKRAEVNDSGDNAPLHNKERHGELSAVKPMPANGDYVTSEVTERNIYTQYKEIVELLKTSNYNFINSKSGKRLNNGRSQLSCNTPQNNNQALIPNECVQNNTPEYAYNKREGTSGGRGYYYEVTLLSLILIRALNDKKIQDFLLGTNIDGVGALDDICLWCQMKDEERPFKLFVQTKYRQDPKKNKLTVREVKSFEGDFSLQKYFESYVMIQDRFQTKSEDPMFQGDFSDGNFVVYTSANVSDCFENQDKKKTEPKINQKVHNLIETNPESNPFQYINDTADIDSLAKNALIKQLNILGKVFLKLVMSVQEYKIMSNQHIAKYHVVMAREVLHTQQQEAQGDHREWKFRPEFFEDKCEYLVALKSTFFKEISTNRYDRSEITAEDRINVINFLEDLSASNLSKLIGKLTTYDEKTKNLHLVENPALRDQFISEEFMELHKCFNGMKLKKHFVLEAVKIKLKSMKIRLPVAFGNLDMTFRKNRQRRMNAVATRLIDFFENNQENTIADINDYDVGPGRIFENGFISINGGIGSAVGNLLILDPETNALKFDLDNEALPNNATLFLKVLKDVVGEQANEKLSRYRTNVNIKSFPIYSLKHDEYNKIQARGYLNKLWFYANQATEDKVEGFVKFHIDKYYHDSDSFKISPDSILLTVHKEIMKWSFESGRVKYLSPANNPFKYARVNIIDDMLKCVSSTRVYQKKISGI